MNIHELCINEVDVASKCTGNIVRVDSKHGALGELHLARLDSGHVANLRNLPSIKGIHGLLLSSEDDHLVAVDLDT